MEIKPRKTGPFSCKERIKKSSDIQRLFKKGKRVHTAGAKLFFLFTGADANRIAFALPRGFGNAVQRNRSKRLSREAYRLLRANMRAGYDMVLLVYPGSDSFEKRCAEMRDLCGKAGLFV